MGCHKNISVNKFPKQGAQIGKKVLVCFHYDTTAFIEGEFVRDDIEEPGTAIIKLKDGRHILSTECQWRSMVDEYDPVIGLSVAYAVAEGTKGNKGKFKELIHKLYEKSVK